MHAISICQSCHILYFIHRLIYRFCFEECLSRLFFRLLIRWRFLRAKEKIEKKVATSRRNCFFSLGICLCSCWYLFIGQDLLVFYHRAVTRCLTAALIRYSVNFSKLVFQFFLYFVILIVIFIGFDILGLFCFQWNNFRENKRLLCKLWFFRWELRVYNKSLNV